MNYAKKAAAANKPGEFGFPFGDFLIQLMKVEEEDREGSKGVEQTYFDWHVMVTEKRHESAQGTKGAIVKISHSWNQNMGAGHNTAFGAAFAGKTFEEFQALEEKTINTYFNELQDAAVQAEKKRKAVLQVKPRFGSDGKLYRDYNIFPADKAPDVYTFDPKTIERAPADPGTTAAAEAGKGTAAKPPTSTL